MQKTKKPMGHGKGYFFLKDEGVFLSPLGKVINWDECAKLAKEGLYSRIIGKISGIKEKEKNRLIMLARLAMKSRPK